MNMDSVTGISNFKLTKIIVQGVMLKINHILIFFVTTLMLTSCIKPFDPEIAAGDSSKLVVSGLVTDAIGYQKVTISRSTSISAIKHEEKPLPGCTVTISDDKGHQFLMTDSTDGNYFCRIDPQYLTTGSYFMVEILTPDGSKIISDYDRLSACPLVDSVYYVRKDLPTTDPAKFDKGIQFYVDLDGNTSDSRYYRWEAVETFEYHAEYPIEWYYDGLNVRHKFPPDYSKDTCWLTKLISDVFTISTENLAENKYQQIPLHFVDNSTERLLNGYSLLVNQYSLSDSAYKYWNQLRINSTNEGGLYERQPLASKGNLHNLTHPAQDVLGFFGVSSVKSKRIFIQKVENLEVVHLSECFPTPLTKYGFSDVAIVYAPKPVYLLGDSTGWKPIVLNAECVDCTASFGKNVKPVFWPN
jgi:hypothetical protein